MEPPCEGGTPPPPACAPAAAGAAPAARACRQPNELGIIIWNINSLAPTVRNFHLRHGSFAGFLDHYGATVACFQEVKLPENKVTKDLACLNGFESFWATSKSKTGYSGVTTWVGSAYSPVRAEIDTLGGGDPDIDGEGRFVLTDHESFVLINVYVPNAGDAPQRPRLPAKLAFLRALRERMDALTAAGRQVVAVGDFNVPAQREDMHCALSYEHYDPQELALMRGLAEAYPDVWRRLHPDARDMYTVWEERKSARAFNVGSRIDYALVSPSLLPHVVSCEILFDVPPKWSDHAPLLLVLSDVAAPAPHPPCALSSSKDKRFHDPSQRSIAAMFGAKASTAAIRQPLAASPKPQAGQAKATQGAAAIAAIPPAVASQGVQHGSAPAVDAPVPHSPTAAPAARQAAADHHEAANGNTGSHVHDTTPAAAAAVSAPVPATAPLAGAAGASAAASAAVGLGRKRLRCEDADDAAAGGPDDGAASAAREGAASAGQGGKEKVRGDVLLPGPDDMGSARGQQGETGWRAAAGGSPAGGPAPAAGGRSSSGAGGGREVSGHQSNGRGHRSQEAVGRGRGRGGALAKAGKGGNGGSGNAAENNKQRSITSFFGAKPPA